MMAFVVLVFVLASASASTTATTSHPLFFNSSWPSTPSLVSVLDVSVVPLLSLSNSADDGVRCVVTVAYDGDGDEFQFRCADGLRLFAPSRLPVGATLSHSDIFVARTFLAFTVPFGDTNVYAPADGEFCAAVAPTHDIHGKNVKTSLALHVDGFLATATSLRGGPVCVPVTTNTHVVATLDWWVSEHHVHDSKDFDFVFGPHRASAWVAPDTTHLGSALTGDDSTLLFRLTHSVQSA